MPGKALKGALADITFYCLLQQFILPSKSNE